MTPRLVPCAPVESLPREPLPRRAWWQDDLLSPVPPDSGEPAGTSVGAFAHEKWWVEEAVECATGSD